MYKVRHEMAPSPLINMFQKTSEVHEYQRGKPNTISYWHAPMPKTNYLKKAFSHRGVVAWNNLPSEIKNSESINIIFEVFEAKLKIINRDNFQYS